MGPALLAWGRQPNAALAMPKVSAGLVMLDSAGRALLVHPGGPYYRRRDYGIWSIPKGAVERGESLLSAARREFEEEVGLTPPPEDSLKALGSIRQSGGKLVHGWAFVGKWDPRDLRSIEIWLEWPPRSGLQRAFPEVDRADFFEPEEAQQRIVAAQWPLVQRAMAWVEEPKRPPAP